jgi:hypothetical protein
MWKYLRGNRDGGMYAMARLDLRGACGTLMRGKPRVEIDSQNVMLVIEMFANGIQ